MRRSALLPAALLACCWLLAAAPTAPHAVHICVRPQGDPPPGVLSAADFTVRLNGKEAPVLNARTPRDGQMILVVLDLAGDMTDAQAAKDALSAALETLPASTFVALLRAQDGPTVLVNPTADRAAIAQAIQAAPVTGKAGLLDSLASVETLAEGIASASNVRVATLYVTDSVVRNYREDFANPVINSSDPHDLSRRFPEALIADKMDKVEKSLAARETPLFIVHLRYRTSTLDAAYQGGLKRLAEETAGFSAFSASTAEIPAAIAKAFAAIVSQYTLTVGLPSRPPAALQIHVATRPQAEAFGDIVYRARLRIDKGKQQR